ncbi:MAG: MFS transporter [Bacilli bacterium]
MLLIIDVIKSSQIVFTGPFLLAFFIKNNLNNIYSYALYNIYSFVVCSVISFIYSYYIKKKNKMKSLRMGILFNILFLFSIVIVKDNIILYSVLLGIFYGLSLATYYMPFNYLVSNEIRETHLNLWFGLKLSISNILQVLFPLIIGIILIYYDYTSVAILFIFIQFINFILTFTFDCKSKKTNNFSYRAFKKCIHKEGLDKHFRYASLLDILIGFSVRAGAMEAIITLYIVKLFKTDFKLGVFTSIFTLLNIITSYIFAHKGNKKDYIKYMTVSGLLIFFSIIIFLLSSNKVTIIFYNLIYLICSSIMFLIIQISHIELSKIKSIKNNYQLELMFEREFYLSIGRVLSYLLLFFSSFLNHGIYLKYLIIIYSASFILIIRYNKKYME